MVIQHTPESILAGINTKRLRRDIAWKNNTPQHFNGHDSSHRSALASYLTGLEVPDIAVCIKCMMNSGPMQKCVVSLDRFGRYKYKACSNCRWNKQSDNCTFSKIKPCTVLRILEIPLGEFESVCSKSCNNNCLAELDLPYPASHRGMNDDRYLPRLRPVGQLIVLPHPTPSRPAPVTRIPPPLALPRPILAPIAPRPTNSRTFDSSLRLPPIVSDEDRTVGDVTVPVGYLENLSATRARQINANTITAETQESFDRPCTTEDRERFNLRLLCIAADHVETFGPMDPRLLL